MIRTLILGLLVCLIASAQAGAAERRALVIGNDIYTDAKALPNARNDARDIAAALRALHFKVDPYERLTLEEMSSALAKFARSIEPGDIALIYYAGHGVQGPAVRESDGTDNYLMPVDADPLQPDRVASEAVSLNDILGKLNASQAGAKIIILDACRSNPWARKWSAHGRGSLASDGLAVPTGELLRGVFIAYAAAPGQDADDNPTGRNGLFTQEILKRIQLPGLTLSSIFDEVSSSVEALSKNGSQQPWTSHSGSVAQIVLNEAPSFPTGPVDPFVSVSAMMKEMDFDDAQSELNYAGNKISFEKDSAELTDSGRIKIAQMTDIIRRHPKTCFKIFYSVSDIRTPFTDKNGQHV